MAELKGWVAFYDDGERYSSRDMNWNDLPLHGMLIAIEFYDDGTKVKHFNKNYYVKEADKMYGTNDIHPYLAKLSTVKMGRWSANSVFGEAMKNADDTEL